MVDVTSKAGKHKTAWSFFASILSNFEKLHKIRIYFSNHSVNKMKLVLLEVQKLKRVLKLQKRKAEMKRENVTLSNHILSNDWK